MKVLMIGAGGTIGQKVKAALSGKHEIITAGPGVVEDSFAELQPLFPGFNSIPMDRVVNAYVRSVEGGITGQIIKVY